MRFSLTVACLVAVVCVLALGQSGTVLAQSPVDWQDTATGLSVDQNAENKTAGLGFVVQAENWPSLSLNGGVANAGWQVVAGPIGIGLGSVETAISGSATVTSESGDWAHNKMTFTPDAGPELQVWVSRLSPAILVQTTSSTLRLLAGDVEGNVFDGPDVIPRREGPAFPKYVAYRVDSHVEVQALSSTEIQLNSLEDNWLLLWYGDNSHFVDTRKPLTYTGFPWLYPKLPQARAYQADAPLLVVFEHQPSTIKHSTEGGIELSYDIGSGYVTVVPLFGREHPESDKTETWAEGLPDGVVQRALWWADRLCSYPVTVRESYSYDAETDTATVTETITFLDTCAGGIEFAPVPPILGITQDTLGVNFSLPVVDGDLNTEFGPMLGVEDTAQYSWSISELARYVDARRVVIDTGQAPLDLEQEFARAIQQIIDAGHFAPWVFLDAIPMWTARGDLYWANPADSLYHLIETAEALPDGELRDELITHIQSERSAYPPEDISNLDLTEGAARGPYSYLGSGTLYSWNENGPRQDAFLENVPLHTYYALARYYDLVGKTPSADVWQKAQEALDRDTREQDWASFYWFDGYDDRRVAVRNANRHFAGLVGFVRLAELAEDPEAETLGRALLAKAAVLRLGMAQYPRYLYSAQLVKLPPEPDWQVRYAAGKWQGYLFDYDWTGPYDDVRQTAMVDQFGVYLYDHSGFMEPGTGNRDFDRGPCSAHLTAFRDLTPELARFLTDFANQDVTAYLGKVEELFPHWYAAFAEGALGAEHNLSHPVDSLQIFIAKALIQGAPPHELITYLDIPWLQEGDFFYLHKLAETVKNYRGVAWTDTASLQASPGSETIHLSWETWADLPPELTWEITYEGPTGDQPSPITGIDGSARTHTLTGLTNYTWYTVNLTGVAGSLSLVNSKLVTAMPTDIFVYLPSILKNP